ncbi:AraC family transcriptional regulator [Pseudomonas sp. UL073]|uniref:AraC family transcriptional regulator n=1 Tax=Zestomonas insulae TaxID=2809017 RepID=A0ABS2I7Z5_9GAMM|nr:AraC family transcriptional regulator [Pseudomonas insulae]MBM7059274.1 AraC family transcriptional regulator [Pseudomonas insulae]
MDWRQKREITGIRHVLEVAQSEGVSVADCLVGSAVGAEALQQRNAQVEAWQELAVIRNLIQRAGRPGLGVLTGQRYHLTSLGLLGFTMLASRTLEEAFVTLGRFQRLALTLCPVQAEPEARGIWTLFDSSVLPLDAQPFVVERGFAASLRVAAELLQGPVVPLAIEFAMPAPADDSVYREAFGCPIRFAAGRNGLLFARADLQRVLPQAHADAREQGEALCEQACAALSLSLSGTPTARLVQQLLIRDSASLLDAATAAQRLGIAERTLHRRLAQEGQSFQRLGEAIKRQLAEQLLSDSQMDIHSIAQRLGYAEAASFSRAFSRWTGQSPGRWRRQAALPLG